MIVFFFVLFFFIVSFLLLSSNTVYQKDLLAGFDSIGENYLDT